MHEVTTSSAYPLVLTNLQRVRCVVIGGGAVAARKVQDLIAGGARPEVISPVLDSALVARHQAGQIIYHARSYQMGDLEGAFLAIAATDDPQVNAAVANEGERRGILVNIADSPAVGSFHTVATVRRGDLLLTVSTGGTSPTLAARIRQELAERYGDEYARLLTLLQSLRVGSARTLTSAQRLLLWRRLVSDIVLCWLKQGDVEQAQAYAHQMIAQLAIDEE